MGDGELTHALEGRRFELPFALVAAVLSTGLLIWLIPVLWLPHIHRSFGNLFGVSFLILLGLIMLGAAMFFASRLLFEIRGAVVTDSKCDLFYRYLGKRTLLLPFGGRVKRNVRLPDLRSESGVRYGILVHRSVQERILIPVEMVGAEDLARTLGLHDLAT
jgi:hypothetical protein